MAHERLSPRQKMIGMMYLVLTAMLALNVSKEAVKAFMRVEQSLKTTVKNYVAKNATIYAEFDKLYAMNKAKYEGLMTNSAMVKQRSDELFDFMQGLKLQIINKAEGVPSKDTPDSLKAVIGNEIFIQNVKKFDENNIPSEILIGAKENGQAFALKALIDSYREDMVKILMSGKKPNLTAAESLKSVFNTRSVKSLEKTSYERWENANFQTLPLVAVVAILSKMQVDVRNAETDILNFLYEQIDAATPRFNKIEATVIAPNFVMQGSKYEAQIFLTATDTTKDPIITLGDYTTSTSADGTISYEMKGGSEPLKVDENGRGIYSVSATSLGPKVVKGLVSIRAADGSVITRPFNSPYVVGAQSVVVSPTAMNVLYVGIDNPLDVSIPGFGSDRIRVSMKTGGSVDRGSVPNPKGGNFPGEWKINPAPGTEGQVAQITVGAAEANGVVTPYGTRPFRIKPLPIPTSNFAGVSGDGSMDKATLVASTAVFANMIDFDFDLRYRVTEFRMTTTVKGYDDFDESKTRDLTPKMKTMISKLNKGERLYFTKIKAVGPDKTPKSLSPIMITVN
jgi:gliding motility-associated protein GldM